MRTTSPRAFLSRTLATLALAQAGLCASACETGTASEEVSVTGVVVRAEPLTRGTGCGTKAGQVYKYVAVATRAGTTTVVDAGIYDCFADAAFVNLPADVNGAYEFDIHVFAFDKTRYDAQVGSINVALARNESGVPVGALDGATALTSLGRTLCKVKQSLTVQSVASCEPLR